MTRLAAVILGVFVVVALLADALASDLPLATRFHGTRYLLPCLTHPRALRAETQQSLARESEWLVPTLIPFGPNQTDGVGLGLAGPSARHWLGTDEVGRDVLARLIHGARVSLFIALMTVLLAVVIGVLIGATAGYFGGTTDLVLSRLIEVMTTFPTVFFLIALLAVLRTQSLWPLVLVLGFTRWPEVARLARAESMRVTQLDFVLAARAMGASSGRIIVTHVVPNAMGPVLVAATFAVGSTLLLETALSYLGLGVAPPTASWGELLTEAHRNLIHPGAWWLAVFPGVAIAAVVLCVNRLGEAMRGQK